MKKTLSQLKKDAKSGNRVAVMVMRCGEPIGERKHNIGMDEPRQMIGANSVDIFFRMPDGSKSALPIGPASLVEYTDETLTTYCPCIRKVNEKEKEIFDAWKKIESTPEYQERLKIALLTDSMGYFYQCKTFFSKHNANYLRGFDWEHGCKADCNIKDEDGYPMVEDKSIKGKVFMQYKFV